MKIQVDNEEILQLSDIRKQVICNDISSDIIDDDLKRRLKYIIEHKYEQCMKRLKDEWIPKLKVAGISSIPLDDDELASIIFSQPGYKDRKVRDLESTPTI